MAYHATNIVVRLHTVQTRNATSDMPKISTFWDLTDGIWGVQNLNFLDMSGSVRNRQKSQKSRKSRKSWKIAKITKIVKNRENPENRENLGFWQIWQVLTGGQSWQVSGQILAGLRPGSGRSETWFWQDSGHFLAGARNRKNRKKIDISDPSKKPKIWAVDRGDRRSQQAVESPWRTQKKRRFSALFEGKGKKCSKIGNFGVFCD